MVGESPPKAIGSVIQAGTPEARSQTAERVSGSRCIGWHTAIIQ